MTIRGTTSPRKDRQFIFAGLSKCRVDSGLIFRTRHFHRFFICAQTEQLKTIAFGKALTVDSFHYALGGFSLIPEEVVWEQFGGG